LRQNVGEDFIRSYFSLQPLWLKKLSNSFWSFPIIEKVSISYGLTIVVVDDDDSAFV
jgi:hypothetical protein